MAVLVISEHDNISLKGATLNTIQAAREISFFMDAEVHVLVAGHRARAVAQAAGEVQGVTKVIHPDAEYLAHGLAENMAAQVLAIASNYSHILFPATASGKNIAPRVAAKLDVGQISDITKVIAADTFERPIYAGNAIATVQSIDVTKVITVRTTGFDPAATTGGSAAVETQAAQADSGKSSFLGSEIAKSDRPELTAAKIIVSGGRALGSAEKFNEVMTPLADKLGAALGASRAAVDAGYAPNDWQVGQTGKIVAPQLYVACGISGAIQHLAGMKDSKVIVAINKDPETMLCTLFVDDHTSKSGVKRYMLGKEPILTLDGKTIEDSHGRRSYVTSAGSAPSLGKHILMSFIPTEMAKVGNKFLVEYLGEQYPCSIAEVGITPVFDSSNERILG